MFGRPTRLPIDPFGTPDRGYATMRVTSPYGPRADGFHGGLDIGNARLGDDVIAVAEGLVISATIQPVPPWNYAAPPDKREAWNSPSYGGNTVVIDHGGGWYSQYAHLRDMAVTAGHRISAGLLVGHVGDTGSAAPPPAGGGGHLHFGIRSLASVGNGHNGWVDPWPLINGTLPDTSLEDDVLARDSNFVKAPWRARARFRSTIRTDTRIDPSTEAGLLEAGAEVTVIATKEGAVYNGDRTWWIFGVEGKGLRTVHSQLLERLPAPAADCTALENKIAGALTAAKGARQAITAVVNELER